jgi:SAM-dependent methyltransferase
MRREAVEQVGGFEEIFRGLYEDQAFFAKVCLSGAVFVSAACSARYRQHANSNCSMSQETGQYAAARPAFLKWLADYLAKRGLQDPEVWKALRSELWHYRHPIWHRIYRSARERLPDKIFRSAHHLRSRWPSLPLIRQLCCVRFRRLQPVGNGRQRGTPIVRYYWEKYLQEHQADIRGTALEIGTTYTIRRLGGQAVMCAEAIDLAAHSPEITVVADLSRADHVPSDRYDCFVNQFTMHLIYDVEAALYHAIRILKPGGTLLINFPCVDYYFPRGLDMGTGEPLFVYWWFTPIQVENLLRRVDLQGSDYTLDIYGNLFTRLAYQMNMPAEELVQRELKYADPGHPLLICARVVKPASWRATKPEYRTPWLPEVTPARWNPVMGHYAT